jgi:hypothetical protein
VDLPDMEGQAAILRMRILRGDVAETDVVTDVFADVDSAVGAEVEPEVEPEVLDLIAAAFMA